MVAMSQRTCHIFKEKLRAGDSPAQGQQYHSCSKSLMAMLLRTIRSTPAADFTSVIAASCWATAKLSLSL